MLYLRDVLPEVIPTIVNRGRKKGYRHYYIEPSEAVKAALVDEKFWAWFRSQPRKKVF